MRREDRAQVAEAGGLREAHVASAFEDHSLNLSFVRRRQVWDESPNQSFQSRPELSWVEVGDGSRVIGLCHRVAILPSFTLTPQFEHSATSSPRRAQGPPGWMGRPAGGKHSTPTCCGTNGE